MNQSRWTNWICSIYYELKLDHSLSHECFEILFPLDNLVYNSTFSRTEFEIYTLQKQEIFELKTGNCTWHITEQTNASFCRRLLRASFCLSKISWNCREDFEKTKLGQRLSARSKKFHQWETCKSKVKFYWFSRSQLIHKEILIFWWLIPPYNTTEKMIFEYAATFLKIIWKVKQLDYFR